MNADVAVVGGGLAGLLVARWLAEAGVDVVLLDAAPSLATPGELGLVEHGVLEHPGRTVASLGDDRARALFAWAARSRTLLEGQGLFEPCGTLWASIFPGERGDIERSVEALERLGRRAVRLAPDDVCARTGGHFTMEALALPGDGRVPLDARQRLLDAAVASGVRVRTGAEVVDVGEGPEGLAATLHDGEALRAEAVVLAAGPGVSALHPALAGLMPARDQGLRFAATPSGPVRAARAGQGWTCWRVDPDGTRIAGARWASPHLEVGEARPGLHAGIQAKLEAFGRDRLGLGDAPVERWSWVFAQTPDGLPVVGPLPGDPRVVACVGFGASPWGLGVAAARSVVDGLLGEAAPEVPWMLSSRRTVRWRYG